MVDDNTKFQILNQKVENNEKILRNLFLFLFLMPIIFLLLESNVIEEVNFTFFSIKQINILLAFFPSIYSLTFLVSLIYREYISKILKELYKIATDESEIYKQFEKENWIKFLDPINLFGEILRSIKAGGLIGCIGAIIVYVPLPFFLITYLFGFFIFFEYYNFTLLNSDVHYTALINIIFSIWIFVITVIYEKSENLR